MKNPRTELLGRRHELTRLDGLLEAAREGRSSVLVVTGEPGIGKTSLLLYALEQAGDLTVLRARGVQTESELAFAALGDFFRPVVGRIERLPAPQAAALESALALGPPVPGDRFTICAATLSLLGAVAEEGPVLGLVDDAHWLDKSSAEALLFAARRLESEGIALVFAMREGETGVVDDYGFDELELGGLGREDAARLLSSKLHGPTAPEVIDRVVEATQGNPVALLEALSLLTEAQLAGEERFELPVAADDVSGEDSIVAPALDEGVAAALEEAAGEARERGGYAEAAATLARAAKLTSDDGQRARRLYAAADDSRNAGRPDQARELLDEALTSAVDATGRARIQHLRGAIEMWFGSPQAAYDLLVAEASRVSDLDPPRAARMLTDASFACFMAADVNAGLETARRAQQLAERCEESEQLLAAGVLGVALLLNGQTPEALSLLRRHRPSLANPDLTTRQLVMPAQVLTWLEEYDLAGEFIDRVITTVRRESRLALLPFPLAARSELDFRIGNWTGAYAGATEAARIAEETGQNATRALALICQARVEAGRGQEESCRSQLELAQKLAPLRVGADAAYAKTVLAFLELGQGRSEEVIAVLEEFGPTIRERGLAEPAVLPWEPDLIEAYVRVGRVDDAARELEILEAEARATGRSWAEACAERCRGLIADEGEFERHFAHAIELHARTPTPFEHARTELCLGERLRRSRRRSDAREPLRSAFETFERLGAEPWAERARVELGASGETARRRDPSAANQLTPQELQVALVVGRGATNREAGAALFLSPKTIEAHLGRIYRKLDVRSRTELARLLASEGALAEAAV